MADTTKFLLRSISVYNYGDNTKAKGTIAFTHADTESKMEFNLNADDCARIFEIMSDRIAQTMGITAKAILADVLPQHLLEQRKKPHTIYDDVVETPRNFMSSEDMDNTEF